MHPVESPVGGIVMVAIEGGIGIKDTVGGIGTDVTEDGEIITNVVGVIIIETDIATTVIVLLMNGLD